MTPELNNIINIMWLLFDFVYHTKHIRKSFVPFFFVLQKRKLNNQAGNLNTLESKAIFMDTYCDDDKGSLP